MQQRRLRFAASQNGRQQVEQTIAVALQLAAESILGRERELRRQSLLTKERAPVVGPTIVLRRSADPVIARPAESLAAGSARRLHPMERCERFAERRAVA